MIGIDSADKMSKEQVRSLDDWYIKLRHDMSDPNIPMREFALIDPQKEDINAGIQLGFEEEMLKALLRKGGRDVISLWVDSKLSEELRCSTTPISIETTRWMYMLAYKRRGDFFSGGDYTLSESQEVYLCPREARDFLYNKDYDDEDAILMVAIPPCLL